MSLVVLFQGVGGGGVTHSAAVALTGAGDVAAAARNENRATVIFGGSGDLGGSAVNESLAVAVFGAAGGLAPTATVAGTQLGAVSFDGAGDVAVSARNESLASFSVESTGDLQAAAVVSGTILAAIAFEGVGDMNAPGHLYGPPNVWVNDYGGGWEDYVLEKNREKFNLAELRTQERQLKKVEKKIRSVEAQVSEKPEGILANLHRLEVKRNEITARIRELRLELKFPDFDDEDDIEALLLD